jgi:hypothetical protein
MGRRGLTVGLAAPRWAVADEIILCPPPRARRLSRNFAPDCFTRSLQLALAMAM